MNARLTLRMEEEKFFYSSVCNLKIEGKKASIDFRHGFRGQELLTSIAISENKMFILNRIEKEDCLYDDWLPLTNLTSQKSRAFIRFDDMALIILPGKLRINVDEFGVEVKAKCFVAFDDKKSLQSTLELNCFFCKID